MKLIVGLGNPGRVYAQNRHNIGFMCLSYFARQHGIPLARKQGPARIGQGEVAGSKLVIARPQTYMNHSGLAVERLLKKFSIFPENLIVIHDDLDLPLARFRISHGAGSGGHKGIDSIIEHLKTRAFTRLRVGIGHPRDTDSTSPDDVIAYVLADFTTEERGSIRQVLPTVASAILTLLNEGLTTTMNRYNGL